MHAKHHQDKRKRDRDRRHQEIHGCLVVAAIAPGRAQAQLTVHSFSFCSEKCRRVVVDWGHVRYR